MSNIMNEQGHTKYPKIVYPHGKSASFADAGTGVTVHSEEEEAEAMKDAPEDTVEDKPIPAGSPGWKKA